MTQEEMQQLVEEVVHSAVENVCGMMLGCPVEVQPKQIIAHPLQESDGVVALVGMAGPWIGTGALTAKPELACKLAEAFLLQSYEKVNDEVLDAVAEIANMVFGNLKTIIEDRVGPMGLSTPTTIFGASFTTKIGGTSSWTLIPVHVCGGELLIQVCMLPNHEGRVPHRLDIVGHMITRVAT
ncbi:MAG TPA: chemotaxis protein CheX [Bryobacteraceae bacterium]|nr:chemotaxis protein CheX [Bryobacteraceae bacterium]